MTRRRLGVFLLGVLIWLDTGKIQAGDDFGLFNFEGYRVQSYRSATPENLEGVTTLDTDRAQQLWQSSDALFVNVQPVLWRQGLFLPSEPLIVIPHSQWLPNVGFGEPEDQWVAYLQHYAQTWAGQVVFYCTPDCWHSWNTARRVAHHWPQLEVFWYRDGIDAWRAAGLPTESLLQPLPLPSP